MSKLNNYNSKDPRWQKPNKSTRIERNAFVFNKPRPKFQRQPEAEIPEYLSDMQQECRCNFFYQYGKCNHLNGIEAVNRESWQDLLTDNEDDISNISDYESKYERGSYE